MGSERIRPPCHRLRLTTTAGGLVLMMVLTAVSRADLTGRIGPSIFLFDASLEEARALALESAAASGWRTLAVTADDLELEQLIEDDDIHDPLAHKVLIRILASFVDEATGIRVILQARQLQSADDQVVITDVTARYAENLENALSSLRRRWDSRRAASGARFQSGAPVDASAHHPEPQSVTIGVWAYYAERYAMSLGCELDPSGATLVQSGLDRERYRVVCHDARLLLIDCQAGDCTTP